jgi:hypothetical protein
LKITLTVYIRVTGVTLHIMTTINNNNEVIKLLVNFAFLAQHLI